jgi:hypothetical protein
MEEEKKYKMWFDKESGILRTEIYVAFDPETATIYFDKILDFPDEQQRYVMVLLGVDAQEVVGKETRKILREKTVRSKWEKIAIYGAKPALRMLAKIMVTAIGRAKNTKFYATEEECLDWLKAEMEKDKTAKQTV